MGKLFERDKSAGFGLKKRLKAVGIHMIFSLIIFAIVMSIIIFIWYPGPHFFINGGIDGTIILILVDLVAGPLLTFFLMNPKKGKKEQRMDIILIVIVQFALLFYGINKIYSQRPILLGITFEGRAQTAIESDLADSDFFDIETIRSWSSQKPPVIFVRKPQNDEEREGYAAYTFLSRAGTIGAAFLYQDIHSEDSLTQLEKIAEFFKSDIYNNEEYRIAIDAFEKKNPNKEFYYFEFFARSGKALLAVDSAGNLVDYLAVERFVVEKMENE